MTIQLVKFDDGIVINGSFPDNEVIACIKENVPEKFSLLDLDPPYGNILSKNWDKVGSDDQKFTDWMIWWTNIIAKELAQERSALYVWGGIGKPHFRPFYRYIVDVEHKTPYLLANHITWKKRRAYGIQHNYLFCREECAYLHLGDDIKKPRKFTVPLLDKKRGYEGFDKEYPAKSEYLRRSNVWEDVTEIFSGKVHGAQKRVKLIEIPIETHTNEGEWVGDFFAGAGTTAFAARKLKRKFVLVEQDPKEFEKIATALDKNEQRP